MKKVLLLLLLLLVAGAGLPQEAGNERFVPFVSKLKARADESRILITWRNPRNLQGTILLYRHTAEIDQDNLADALRIARLASDQESYEDTPPEDKPYFYAVLIEEADATIQQLFIPFRNKSSEGVRISVAPPVESSSAKITDIRAVVTDDSVRVDFETSNPEAELLLFRSSYPMANTEDLLEAFAPIQLEAGTMSFIDYPIPGVESYYAVVDTEMFKLGKQVLVAGENTSAHGVVIPLEVSRVGLLPEAGIGPETGSGPEAGMEATSAAQAGSELEATPLPYLQLAETAGSSFSLLERRADLDPQTREAISRILSSTAPVEAPQKSVVILPEDKDEPMAGESTGLYNTLQDYLLAGDYARAETKLLGFLNLRRSAYTEARVRFYLAQAYYFQGLYEEALLEFVLAQGQLYAPVQPWLQSCFRHIWEEQ